MIKNRCFYLFFIFALCDISIIASDKEKQDAPHVYSFAIKQTTSPKKTIGQLAQELEPFNTTKIKDYQWTCDQDHVYTEPTITKEERQIVGAILSQLTTHRNNQTPLSIITSEEQALSIKESFFNVLLNSRCAADEQVKLGYDMMNGSGSFFAQYGNYKKSAQFNPAHNFAVKVWPHCDHNNISITDLVKSSEDSIAETGEAWLNLKTKIESDSCKRFSKSAKK
jgi:hypothetical protein